MNILASALKLRVSSWVKTKTILGLAAGFLLALSVGQAAEATNYYVSKKGSNTDGTTLPSAWNELNQIKWSAIKGGDLIYVEGGSYSTALDIHYNENAQVSTVDARNPVYLINLTPGLPVKIQGGLYGINFNNSTNVAVCGFKKGDFLITSCTRAGVNFGVGAASNTLVYVEVQRCSSGINLDGINQYVWSSQIHDNAVNVYYGNARPAGSYWFQRCWIYNSELATSRNRGGDGIQLLQHSSNNVLPTVNLVSSVIGPNLPVGILTVGNGGALVAMRSLFLNSHLANLDNTFHTNGTVSLDNCTSYMTKLNASNGVHNIISLNSGTLNLNNSVFYGGNVRLKSGAVKVVNQSLSTVFQTTGSPLPAYNADPGFANLTPAVKAYTASLQDFVDADFANKINPSSVGSIKALLK
jgi:hypothetical protein